MDFGLDLPADVAAAPAPALPQTGSDPLADLDRMDFDLPASAVPAAPAAAEPAMVELSADDFADSLQLQGEPDAPAAAEPAAKAFDLSGIDLDLDTAGAATAAAAEARPAAQDDVMSAHHMEMDTKLDLAIAYQEIGDKEGARELLDEVLRGGSDDQVARANAMKAQLA
jgi:pilus assembly protein FimV